MARYGRSRWQQIAAAAILVAIFLWRLYDEARLAPGSGPARQPVGGPPARSQGERDASVRAGGLPPGDYKVDRVVDGDTVMIATRRGVVRVRLQGIDAPETVKEDSPVQKWGPEATAFTRQFVREAHGRLTVEVDGEPVDQYGRYLAFLWADDRLLNEELVRAGLARAKLGYDYSQAKKDRLRRAQQQAQTAARGVWSD